MKNFIWPALNTALIFMLFMYIFISKDINTQAYNKCIELEQSLKETQELTSKALENVSQKDTIVINIKNYNYLKK